MLQTAVALIIFNRADTTARVFAEIAKAKPRKLLIIADGPRSDRPGEADKCARARAVVECIDWDCEVIRNYSEQNLGCKRRMASGIDWVFEQVEEAIILEDDCLPLPTFFRFCDELLERYRHDERVMCISGINLESGLRARPFSYRFSCFNLCWGWASWRRAWRYFDMTLKLWPALRHTSWLPDILEDHKAVEFYKKEFNWAYERAGDLDNWDYQWTFACWAQHGLSILPTTALVTNIGFGEQATHTKLAHDKRAFLPTQEISFPLQHPSYVIRDREADQVLMRQIVVFNQSEEFCGYSWLRQKYRALLTRHPSLKSPRAFIRRVGERCSAAVAGAARKLMASL